MNSRMTGVVEQISEKEGKFGPMISYKIGGEWMLLKGCKFKQRGINEGDLVDVEFVVKDNGYKDIVKGGLVPSTAEGKPSEPAPAGSPKPTATPYKDPRQSIISKQAAMNTALAFVGHAIAIEAVPFSLAKKSDNLALLINWVNTEASRFYELSTGEKWDISEQAPTEVKKPAKKVVKKAEPEEEDTGADEYPDEYDN